MDRRLSSPEGVRAIQEVYDDFTVMEEKEELRYEQLQGGSINARLGEPERQRHLAEVDGYCPFIYKN